MAVEMCTTFGKSQNLSRCCTNFPESMSIYCVKILLICVDNLVDKRFKFCTFQQSITQYVFYIANKQLNFFVVFHVLCDFIS